MLDAIARILRYTRGCTLHDFAKNEMAIAATTRELEIIGEAAGQLPAALRKRYADVPWQDIKDFRNVVIHQYLRVETKILWNIITQKLPSLIEQIEGVLEQERSHEAA